MWSQPFSYSSAKSTVSRLGKEIDIETFKSLDLRFGNVDKAKRLRDEASAAVSGFFGESPLLLP